MIARFFARDLRAASRQFPDFWPDWPRPTSLALIGLPVFRVFECHNAFPTGTTGFHCRDDGRPALQIEVALTRGVIVMTASALEDEIAHLRELDLPGLRARWHSVFRRKAPITCLAICSTA